MSKPLRVRIPARTREKVEAMCAQYAANLAAVILQAAEQQLTAELQTAMRQPAAHEASRRAAGVEVLSRPAA